MDNLGFKIYIFYTSSIFLHLGSRIPVLGIIRIDLLIAGLLIVSLFIQDAESKSGGLFDGEIGKWLKYLIIYFLITIPLVAFPGSVVRSGLIGFLKAAVFYFFTVKYVNNEKRLKIFLFTFVFAQAFRSFEPLYLHIAEGYWGSRTYIGGGEFAGRLGGAPHDIVNPNGLAFVIVTAFIFHHYLSSGLKLIFKTIYFAALPLYLYALVLTGSRSGFLSLAVSVGVIIWQSKRKLALIVMCSIIALIGFSKLDPQQRERYYSIFGGSGAQRETAVGRFEGIKAALGSFLERPIVGHGLGTSAEASYHSFGAAQPAHNLFAEVLQEVGLIGFYLLIMLFLVIQRQIRSFRESTDALKSLYCKNAYSALTVYFYMIIIFSLATYGLSNYPIYLCAGLITSLTTIAKEEKKKANEQA